MPDFQEPLPVITKYFLVKKILITTICYNFATRIFNISALGTCYDNKTPEPMKARITIEFQAGQSTKQIEV